MSIQLRNMTNALAGLSCILLLAACNKPPEPKVEPSASTNFLADQKAQLDKAKEAAQVLQKAADAQREVVEVNTGGKAAKPAKKTGEQ